MWTPCLPFFSVNYQLTGDVQLQCVNLPTSVGISLPSSAVCAANTAVEEIVPPSTEKSWRKEMHHQLDEEGIGNDAAENDNASCICRFKAM